MPNNPYESPNETSDSTEATEGFLGRVGIMLSLFGVAGVLLTGPFGPFINNISMRVALLSLPGLIISTIGLWQKPGRLAGWGVALGIIGSLYLPTFYLSMWAGD